MLSTGVLLNVLTDILMYFDINAHTIGFVSVQ